MYCPDEYLTLYEVMGGLSSIAVDRVKEKPASEKPEGTTFWIATGDEWELEENAYREWLFTLFMKSQWNNLFACSPQGVLMRLSRDVTSASRIYDGPFPEDEAGQKSLINYMRNGLNHIDNFTFQIDPQKAEVNRDEYDDGSFSRALLPLAGWPVCWKPPRQNITNDDIHQICLEARNATSSLHQALTEEPTRRRGRPKLADGRTEMMVQREFDKRRRDGKLTAEKRDAVVHAAIEWVRFLTDDDVTRTTMQRYLAPVFEKVDAQK